MVSPAPPLAEPNGGRSKPINPRLHATRWTVEATLPVSYDVCIADDILDPDDDVFEKHAFCGSSRRRLVIVEQSVFDIFGERLLNYLEARRLPAEIVCVAADERRKNMELSLRLVAAIDEFSVDRRSEPLIVMGGGVILDAAGCAAGLYRRGTPYVRVPTSLVAQVDAGIGIKTGINHDGHKNRLGSYHPPQTTLIDPGFLSTLPLRHVSNGMAEIAKMALVGEEKLWDLIEAHAELLVQGRLQAPHPLDLICGEVLDRAVSSMIAELAPNLWEHDLRRLVDFGHTFSPAMEMAAMPRLLHGEAVSIDMALTCCIGMQRGLLPRATFHRIVGTLTRLGLPVWHDVCQIPLLERSLDEAVRHRGGQQSVAIPVAPGNAIFVNDIGTAELRRAAFWLNAHHRSATTGHRGV
jgi:3-dehydroquinate synthetase